MHRLILGMAEDAPQHVRHANTCGLDNRRSNLQIISDVATQRDRALTLRRTWDDFVEHAYELFGNLADHLAVRMGQHRLTQNQIMFYLNWTFGMTHQEIADHFGTSRPGVTMALQRLRNKWPDLFRFPPREDVLSYDPERHDPFVVRQF